MSLPLPNATTLTPDEAEFQDSLLTDLKTMQAALDYWTGYLKRKYAISATDRITENGAILRGIVAAPTSDATSDSAVREA